MQQQRRLDETAPVVNESPLLFMSRSLPRFPFPDLNYFDG